MLWQRGRGAANNGRGKMDDILKRLGEVENDLSGIKAQTPHLATQADVSDLKASIIQWAVGTTIATAGLVFAIANFIH